MGTELLRSGPLSSSGTLDPNARLVDEALDATTEIRAEKDRVGLSVEQRATTATVDDDVPTGCQDALTEAVMNGKFRKVVDEVAGLHILFAVLMDTWWVGYTGRFVRFWMHVARDREKCRLTCGRILAA